MNSVNKKRHWAENYGWPSGKNPSCRFHYLVFLPGHLNVTFFWWAVKVNHYKKLIFFKGKWTNIPNNSKFPPILFMIGTKQLAKNSFFRRNIFWSQIAKYAHLFWRENSNVFEIVWFLNKFTCTALSFSSISMSLRNALSTPKKKQKDQ